LTAQRPQTTLHAAATLLAGAAAGLALLSSCATVDRTVAAPPHIEGATFVGNAACADCHTNYTRGFAASPHGRFHREDARMAGQTGCESCHGPGSKHVAAAGARQFIVNPGRDPAACFACHLETHAEFHLPHRHPVLEGRLNCVQCHDPHGPDLMKPAGGLAMARLNETCAACHREQARPFVFEHEALREGCVACHQPHGSIAPGLLAQRDANLCLKCHAQVQMPGAVMIGKTDHAQLLRLGSCWSAGCHTAVHGSNIHPKMLY
jgi:predicted CXXCH cytochrome family protein